MKKLCAAIVAILTFTGLSASAQTPKEKMGKQILMDSLKINSTTADSVLSVRERSMAQLKTIMSDQSLTQDQKKEKARPIKQEMKTSLQKYLSNDQLQKLQEMEMARRKGKGDQ